MTPAALSPICVLADRSGDVRLFKALSTPADPTRAIEEGMKLIAEDLGESPAEIVSNSDLCINGTTVGLNALIQHKGGKTGLICTAGHEDSIEIRIGHKEDGYRYDPEYPAAIMLVPRYLRRGVRERVISNGSIKTPLNEDDVRAACRFLIEEGVEAVAISFVWSVLNQSHERRAAEIVREMMPRDPVTVGSELYPQVREYTRTSTAVVNAYLAPILTRYVAAVDEYFRKLGAKYPVRYFQSNGGLGLGQAITERSVYAINSGPASAPQAGLFVTAPFKKKNVITIDMGGTSFDITLTRNGLTNLNKNIDFLRYRIGVPMIQVETLGAGGGSIGWIDCIGILQVGPQCAGADPGPACYGQGGTQPTVTDANLVLGYLNPKGLLGGTLPLDLEKARKAIKKRRRPARHIGRARRLRHVHHRQQQHGERHPPRLGGARLRSARLRAGRRRRRDRRAHHRARPRDGHRYHHSAETRIRALRFRPDHLGRQIQLHGHRPVRLEQGLRSDQPLFEQIEAQGVKHLVATASPNRRSGSSAASTCAMSGRCMNARSTSALSRSTRKRSRRLKTRSTGATRNSTPIPSGTTRSRWSTSRSRSTATSTSRNRRA